MPYPILIATTNPAKEAKLTDLLDEYFFQAVPLREYPSISMPDETSEGFTNNAIAKATQASGQFDGLAIASDGGVRIPALPPEEWVALHTGRAAGPNATDAERAQHLLSLMKGKQGDERNVRWVEGVAIASQGDLLAAWESDATEGILLEEYDPSNAIQGFWVYSLWQFPVSRKRYVDLAPEDLANEDLTWALLKAQIHLWLAQQDLG